MKYWGVDVLVHEEPTDLEEELLGGDLRVEGELALVRQEL